VGELALSNQTILRVSQTTHIWVQYNSSWTWIS